MSDTEEWKIHLKSGYEVSSFGRVKGKFVKFKKSNINSHGYQVITLGKTNYGVHRLVYETFIGVIPDNKVVNHKNGIKTDNRLSNLECVSQKENCNHSISTNLSSNYGETHKFSKITDSDVLKIIDLFNKNIKISEIAEQLNISKSLVWGIVSGNRWKHITKGNRLYFPTIKRNKIHYQSIEKITAFNGTKEQLKELSDSIGVTEDKRNEIIEMGFQKAIDKYVNSKLLKTQLPADISNEKWVIYKNLLVSDYGRFIGMKGKLLKPSICSGYYTISICGKSRRVNRTVWQAFHGDIPSKYVINHKDGNKLNNKLSNLECVTYKENSIHAIQNGLKKIPVGANCHSAKFTSNQVADILKEIISGKSSCEIANERGVSDTCILSIKHGKSWNKEWRESGISNIDLPDNRYKNKRNLPNAIELENIKKDVKNGTTVYKLVQKYGRYYAYYYWLLNQI